MADLSDVGDAICDLIQAAVYPNGLNAQPLPPNPVKIYRGHPDPPTLDADLQQAEGYKRHHISVFAPPGGERNTTRYPDNWIDRPSPAKTYQIQAAGQVITISGAAPDPYVIQNFAVFLSGKSYVHQATEGQAPGAIAEALRILIAADWPGVTRLAATLTIPPLARIGALRVGSMGSSIKEVGRQTRLFHISTWTDSDEARTALARLIDPVLRDTRRLVFPDGFGGRFIYQSAHDIDRSARMGAYRRVSIYTVEYPTTREIAAPELIVGRTTYRNQAGDLLAFTEE